MRIMIKNKKIRLSETLNQSEIDCKCNYLLCNYTLLHDSVLRGYNILRGKYSKPIRVNSAFRCQSHNESVGGLPNSYHTVGLALDLSPSGKMVEKEFKYQLERLKLLAETIFDVVIVYETFIHCHNKEIING